MKIIIANSASYFNKHDKLLFLNDKKIEYFFITKKEELNIETLSKLKPDHVFFIHWSYILPEKIYSQFKCIIFHMTDLPFGRGGSPLQNLIARKIYQTKITAIKCAKGLDAGDIYLKSELSLYGNAQEIYLRATKIIYRMIEEIITKKINPIPQVGKVVQFKRRKPEDSDISQLFELEDIFDAIRMLDAEGYPKAFLQTSKVVFEFTRASFKGSEIMADVTIRLK